MINGSRKKRTEMAGESKDEIKLSFKDHALAGSVSGVITRALCQPLDVLKIRFQLQIHPKNIDNVHRSSRLKYSNILQAIKMIYLEEGIKAFWKGHVPAQALSVIFSGVQFSVYNAASSHLLNKNSEFSSLSTLLAGGIAGSAATVVCQPFDVIRTRLVGQGEPKVYLGVLDAVCKINKLEGLRTYYKGLIPTLIQIAPNAGCMFVFYESFRAIWKKVFYSYKDHVGFYESTVCGLLAGMCSKTIVHPLDVIKKQLQIQGFQEGRKMFGTFNAYNGFSNCFLTIIREEGLGGMFKGIKPSLLKAAFSTASHFTVYEQICYLFKLRYTLLETKK